MLVSCTPEDERWYVPRYLLSYLHTCPCVYVSVLYPLRTRDGTSHVISYLIFTHVRVSMLVSCTPEDERWYVPRYLLSYLHTCPCVYVSVLYPLRTRDGTSHVICYLHTCPCVYVSVPYPLRTRDGTSHVICYLHTCPCVYDSVLYPLRTRDGTSHVICYLHTCPCVYVSVLYPLRTRDGTSHVICYLLSSHMSVCLC